MKPAFPSYVWLLLTWIFKMLSSKQISKISRKAAERIERLPESSSDNRDPDVDGIYYQQMRIAIIIEEEITKELMGKCSNQPPMMDI